MVILKINYFNTLVLVEITACRLVPKTLERHGPF